MSTTQSILLFECTGVLFSYATSPCLFLLSLRPFSCCFSVSLFALCLCSSAYLDVVYCNIGRNLQCYFISVFFSTDCNFVVLFQHRRCRNFLNNWIARHIFDKINEPLPIFIRQIFHPIVYQLFTFKLQAIPTMKFYGLFQDFQFWRSLNPFLFTHKCAIAIIRDATHKRIFLLRTVLNSKLQDNKPNKLSILIVYLSEGSCLQLMIDELTPFR